MSGGRACVSAILPTVNLAPLAMLSHHLRELDLMNIEEQPGRSPEFTSPADGLWNASR